MSRVMGWKNVSVRARQIDTGRDKESLAQNDPLEGGDGWEPNVSTFRGTESDLRKHFSQVVAILRVPTKKAEVVSLGFSR